MLVCFNDGKEECESYVVWDDNVRLKDVTTKGYGADMEEAVLNYKSNLIIASAVFSALAERVNNDDSVPVDVNYEGLTTEKAEEKQRIINRWIKEWNV